MTTDIPADRLAALVPPDDQRLAARMAQDAFATIFRLAFAADAGKLSAALADLDGRCDRWCQAGAGPEEQALRRALLIGGLDQWGLAYSQAFELAAIPALWALHHLVKSAVSTWGGALSDRAGRRRVILLGWGVYAVAYAGFAAAGSQPTC